MTKTRNKVPFEHFDWLRFMQGLVTLVVDLVREVIVGIRSL
jgi:hypothetical protein